MSEKRFQWEAGTQQLKDKNISEDLSHDLWIMINSLLNSKDFMDRELGKGFAKKYYLKPNGEEYK